MIRFPAEWELQSAVLIAWPHETGDFKHLDEVETSYRFIAETVSRFQKLLIVCRDDEHENRIRGQIDANRNMTFARAKVNDIWVRDTVFLTVEEDGKPVLLNLIFNGWGEKYRHDDDNALNTNLLAAALFHGVTTRDVDFILEGGSVESDGKDTIMTTRQCLLNPNRNKGLTRHEIERALGLNFGASRVFWIDQPNLPGDDTDAHIDTLARFCDAHTIAYTASDDESDPQYESLKHMEIQLQALRTRSNKPYRLVPLPLPKAIFDEEGRQLPANYSNFLIINGAVMVPAYGDANDAIALERLAGCFPDREIIATPCRPLVHQYGSLHCMTMQFPAAVFG